MAYAIKLVNLQCNVSEDYWNGDEAYLKIDGNTVWSGEMSAGQNVNFDFAKTYSFSTDNATVATLSLFDEDISWIGDDDDFLGSHTVAPEFQGLGYHTASFTQDGANYTLTYAVGQTQVIGF